MELEDLLEKEELPESETAQILEDLVQIRENTGDISKGDNFESLELQEQILVVLLGAEARESINAKWSSYVTIKELCRLLRYELDEIEQELDTLEKQNYILRDKNGYKMNFSFYKIILDKLNPYSN